MEGGHRLSLENRRTSNLADIRRKFQRSHFGIEVILPKELATDGDFSLQSIWRRNRIHSRLRGNKSEPQRLSENNGRIRHCDAIEAKIALLNVLLEHFNRPTNFRRHRRAAEAFVPLGLLLGFV